MMDLKRVRNAYYSEEFFNITINKFDNNHSDDKILYYNKNVIEEVFLKFPIKQ